MELLTRLFMKKVSIKDLESKQKINNSSQKIIFLSHKLKDLKEIYSFNTKLFLP